MSESAATWALVVGIDAYANPEDWKPLVGAVNDALAAVEWLRALGVPDDQILLCTGPAAGTSPAPAPPNWSQPNRPATVEGIWSALKVLRANRGERLFVFLSGHGVRGFDSVDTRLFIAQDADVDDVKNLGLRWYADFLRSLDYGRQYLFLDGCQTPVATAADAPPFRAGYQSQLRTVVADASVAQVLCTATKPGEEASEDLGTRRGLFFRRLFEVLDPHAPPPAIVSLDPETGVPFLDLAKAMTIVGPAVSADADKLGGSQVPTIEGDVAAGLRILDCPVADGTVELKISVVPPAGADAVATITLGSPAARRWNQTLPIPPATEHTVRVPIGWKISALATMSDDVHRIEPRLHEWPALTADTEFVFRIETGPPGTARIVAADEAGAAQTIRLPSDAAEAIASHLPAMPHAGAPRYYVMGEAGELITDDLQLPTTAFGRQLGDLTARRRGWDTARLLLDVVDRHTASNIHPRLEGVTAADIDATLTFDLTEAHAHALAGPLLDIASVEVQGLQHRLSALAAQPSVTVDPGQVTIDLRLPWGEHHVVHSAAPGEHLDIALPAHVGRPPLRVGLLAEHAPSQLPRARWTVIRTAGAALRGTVATSDGAALGKLVKRPASQGAVAVSAPDWKTPPGEWDAVVTFRHEKTTYCAPLRGDGPLVIATPRGAPPRAEPLSTAPLELWDQLLGAGDLTLAADRHVDVEQLVGVSAVLGLAAGYALAMRGDHRGAREVLAAVDDAASGLADTAILRASIDGSKRERRAAVETLRGLGPTTPLLRWGVPLGRQVARSANATALADHLTTVERGLLAGSVWTLWRAEA